MESPKHKTLILQSALFFSLFLLSVLHAPAQTLPPARVDGFVYKNTPVDSDTIIIEAFYDPVCPDSRDSWPPLKQALRYYGSRAWLVVHLFPLPQRKRCLSRDVNNVINLDVDDLRCCPSRNMIDLLSENCSYHDNAFVASRALHIVNSLNDSATFPLLEHFFKYQRKFYNAQTRNLSRAHVVSEIVKFTTEVVGNSYYSAVKSGFNDTKTDLKTRVSFKYGASRGVYGTPFFYVNGFLLADAGSTIGFSGWRNIIDPLIRAHGVKSDDTVHFFL